MPPASEQLPSSDALLSTVWLRQRRDSPIEPCPPRQGPVQDQAAQTPEEGMPCSGVIASAPLLFQKSRRRLLSSMNASFGCFCSHPTRKVLVERSWSVDSHVEPKISDKTSEIQLSSINTQTRQTQNWRQFLVRFFMGTTGGRLGLTFQLPSPV